MSPAWPLVVLGVVASSVRAQSLATDPLATQTRIALSPNAGIRVESAAYAPGVVGGPASIAGEWVYAYQVFAVTEPLSIIDVVYVLGAWAHNAGINPAYGVPGGFLPMLSGPGGFGTPGVGGVRAEFSSPLEIGARSQVFYVSSLQGPWDNVASIPGDPGPTFFGPVLGPVPSPGTGAAVVVGLMAFGRRRRAMRREA